MLAGECPSFHRLPIAEPEHRRRWFRLGVHDNGVLERRRRFQGQLQRSDQRVTLIASELHQVGCHTDLCLSRIADRWVVVRNERRLTLRNGPCASAWSTLMDRFFSKLDLRDIKIDPERSRFSPDDDSEIASEVDG